MGRLFSCGQDQNSLVISLPATLTRVRAALTVSYSGRIEPGSANDESLGGGGLGGSPQLVGVDSKLLDPEPSYLYSNQTFWYPRPATSDYATATLRITVPAYLSCVASGEREATPPMVVAARPSTPPLKTYVFNAVQPVRYLAFVVSRLEPIRNITVDFPTNAVNEAEWPSGSQYRALNVSVEANPGHVGRGRTVAERVSDIARFYHSLVGDSPYPTLTVTLVERSVPGGHSPGYFVLNYEPLPLLRTFAPRDDRRRSNKLPDYVLAHERPTSGGARRGVAHVSLAVAERGRLRSCSPRTPSDRAAEGRAVFAASCVTCGSGIGEVAAGPISLGSRLGQLQDDSRIFRALVYGKTALVLQMLRDLVGDEAFFRGLRRFYRTSRFRSVGTDDFQTAMEMETGRPLDRFFGRWIDGSELPRLGFSYRVDGNEAVLRIEQVGDLFDLPVRVTLLYASGPPSDVLVPVTDRVAELRVPLRGPLRTAEISRDDPPLAEIVRN